MKYFIIAGEPSGDLHGSNLVKNLISADKSAVIHCWGGDMMKGAGATLLKHYNETAFMGAWEVLVNIRKVRRNFRECRQQIAEFMPDVVILIDYPGFNLRMARYTRGLGLKVFYYISPKFWAWREGRVKHIKASVDRLYIIFPFEKEFFRGHGIEASFLGNPLIDQVSTFKSNVPGREDALRSLGLDSRPVIALLSGSREQEVRHMLPVMAGMAGSLPDYQFVVAAMDHLPGALYEKAVGSLPVTVVTGHTYELLSVAEAALVTSGTATLEAALFNVPQVVCYRTSGLTYRLAKMVVRVRFISLVNLIMDREIVKELIQDDLNPVMLHRELLGVINNGYRHRQVLSDYKRLRTALGDSGASARIAADMVKHITPGTQA